MRVVTLFLIVVGLSACGGRNITNTNVEGDPGHVKNLERIQASMTACGIDRSFVPRAGVELDELMKKGKGAAEAAYQVGLAAFLNNFPEDNRIEASEAYYKCLESKIVVTYERQVKVLYATNRERMGDSYGSAYEPALKYGVQTVTIPSSHSIGEIERPDKFLFVTFEESPDKHVVIRTRQELGLTEFRTFLENEAAEEKSALLFVHGFNVVFDDAIRRTAQLAYDLGFEGAPILFSWPSDGNIKSYLSDEEEVVLSIPHLDSFLRSIATTKVQKIYLLAHSMGSRALTNAVVSAIAHLDKPNASKFRELVLAAPDISQRIFVEQIAPGLRRMGARITLYVSSEDKALAASRTVHDSARVGQAGDKLLVLQGIETIDASDVGTGLFSLDHSGYGDTREMLNDLHGVLDGKAPVDRFGLREENMGHGKYWRLVN